MLGRAGLNGTLPDMFRGRGCVEQGVLYLFLAG